MNTRFLFGLRRFYWYVFLEAIPYTGLTILVLSSMVLAQQVTRQSDLLFGSPASSLLSLQIILLMLPSILVITLPFSLLIGALIALNRLSADSEMIAARSQGLSLIQISLPLIIYGLLGTAASYLLTMQTIPQVFRTSNTVRNELIRRALSSSINPQIFETQFPNYVILVNSIEEASGDWLGVFLIHQTKERNRIVVSAKRAQLVMTQTAPITLEINLVDGLLITVPSINAETQSAIQFQQQKFKISSENTRFAQSLERGNQELSLKQLKERSESSASPQERRQAEVEWHKRLALPLACLVLIFLAIPLGITPPRQTGRAIAFSLGVGLAVGYYLILLAGQNLALSGRIPVWLGVWSANIVAGLGALHFYLIPRKSRPSLSPKYRAATPKNTLKTKHKLIQYSIFSLFPGLINRLLFLEMTKYLSLAALFLLLLSLIFTLFDIIPSLSRSRLGGEFAALYLLYLAPQILYIVGPFAVLLAYLITHGILSRSQQIIAILLSGYSRTRINLPFLLCTLLAIIGLYWISEQILPYSNREQDSRYAQIKGKKIEQATLALGQHWVRGEDGTIYAYQYNATTNELLNTTAYRRSGETKLLHEIIQAQGTHYINETSWQVTSGWRLKFSPGLQVSFHPLHLQTPYLLVVPDSNAIFRRVVNEATKMNFTELRQYIQYLSKLNAPTTSLRVELEKKVAFPFSCLTLILIAFPFTLRNARRGTITGIGISIIIGFTYWISAGFFESLGRQAYLPPGLSVWGPQALFIALGLFLAFRLRS